MTLAQLRKTHARAERTFIRRALVKTNWRLTITAKDLDIPPPTLHRLIMAHGLGEDYAAKGHPRGRPKK